MDAFTRAELRLEASTALSDDRCFERLKQAAATAKPGANLGSEIKGFDYYKRFLDELRSLLTSADPVAS